MRSPAVAIVGAVLGVVLVLVFLYNLLRPARTRAVPLTDYSRLVADIDGGKIANVVFSGVRITGRLTDGQVFESYAPHSDVVPALVDRLLAKGIGVAARPVADEEVVSVLSVLINYLPLIVFYTGLYYAIARPMVRIARQVEAVVKLTRERISGPPPSEA